MSGDYHLVEARWWCDCDRIECCRTEVYVSDIRILQAELETLKAEWAASVSGLSVFSA